MDEYITAFVKYYLYFRYCSYLLLSLLDGKLLKCKTCNPSFLKFPALNTILWAFTTEVFTKKYLVFYMKINIFCRK